MKKNRLIFIILLTSGIRAQSDVVLSEIPGTRNKEDFVVQFFNDYKGMTWTRTVNKLYRITGNRDELCKMSNSRPYLIKDAQCYDSLFYLCYLDNTLFKFNIKSRSLGAIRVPSHLKKAQIIFADKSWFLVFSKTEKKLYKLRYANSRAAADSFAINIQDPQLFTYLGCEAGIVTTMTGESHVYDLRTKKSRLLDPKFYTSMSSCSGNKLVMLQNGKSTTLLFGRDHRGDLYIHKQESRFKYPPVQYMTALKDYTLYREMDNDYYLLENDKGHVSRFRFMNSDGVPYRFQNIYTVYENFGGKICISTEKGIFLFDPEASGIIDYYPVKRVSDRTNNNSFEVRSALYNAANRELLLGIKNEGVYVYRFDTTARRFVFVNKMSYLKDQYFDNSATKVYQDRSGAIWIGGYHGVRVLSKSGTEMFDIPNMWEMTEDDEYFWLVNPVKGLYCIHKQSRKVENYAYPGYDHEGNAYVWHVLQEGQYLYLSSHAGIFVFDKTARTFHNLYNKSFDGLFTDQMCWELTQDYSDPDNLIVSTQASGLYCVSKLGKNKRRILEGVDEIFQCYSGPFGNIATSRHSLYYFDRYGREYIRFNAGNYPIPGDLGFHGFCKIGEDQLCVTGANGFSIIHLEELKDHISRIKPAMFIQDIDVLNHRVYYYPESTDIIRLNYRNNHLKIRLNSDDLGASSDMNIRYYLSGEEDTFRLFNTNEISFTSLAPGSYRLNIFCQTAKGIWNKQPIKAIIRIAPPWYETFTAKVGYLLLCLLLLWGLFSRYRKQSERRKKMELVKLENELKSLRSQMNPHFMFNALNAIQHYMLNSDKEKANIYLSDFSKLIRQILDNSSKETLSLQEETDWLRNYLNLEKLRHGGQLEFAIEIEEELDMHIEVPSMILQPFVENAIQHGLFNKKEKGMLKIRIYRHDDSLLNCMIEDNGIGMEASAKLSQHGAVHESRGIAITQKRMKYINEKYHRHGTIRLVNLQEKGQSAGTRVNILLPYFGPFHDQFMHKEDSETYRINSTKI